MTLTGHFPKRRMVFATKQQMLKLHTMLMINQRLKGNNNGINYILGWAQWVIPVILLLRRWRIAVQGQSGQKVSESPSQQRN
jgi:hypothetical protein